MTSGVIDQERRSQLYQAKLRALVDEHVDPAVARTFGFPAGAALARGSAGWFLAEDRPERSLGPALAWAAKQQVTELTVIAEEAGVLARQAAYFVPSPSALSVSGTDLVVAAAEGFQPPEPPLQGVETLVELLESEDLRVLFEHGEVRGEWLGLPMARITATEEGPRLEVGVGRHDRDAFAIVHGDLPAPAALRQVLAEVRSHRSGAAGLHPLNRLAPERRMRDALLRHPERVGLAADRPTRPVEPLQALESVKDAIPAALIGSDPQGGRTLVVCSVGIDLDLVPYAADLRAREIQRGESVTGLILALPERDAIGPLRTMADQLRDAANIVTVEVDEAA